MALNITTQDIIIDESTGRTDDDFDTSVLPLDPTLVYLLSLDDDPGGLTPPEVAFQANFVVATADAEETITSVVLSQNLDGTPFSTTVGVNSYIRTVDGNYVWLFQDADPTHANVVIGVIGTADPLAEPAEDGPLAFSFALISTSNTNADLYTVQYVPLFHLDPTNPDDRIDLTNKVFASVTGTSGVNFFSGQNAAPGNHDFYLINSTNDSSTQILVTGFLEEANATANVSTQGFGVNNQSINPDETLQVDFVTGGTLPAGDGSQIQYGSHLDNVTQAGFTINQITPSNPNLRVDIIISTFNVTGNEQGSSFYDGSPTTAAPITSLTLTGQSGFASPITVDGTYNVAGSVDVTVSGLGTGIVTITGLDNVTTVDVTTSSQMDRLTVTGVDSNEGLDITEFHFSSQTTDDHTEEVGSFINFDDDGPTITVPFDGDPGTADIQHETLANALNASATGAFGYDIGADAHLAAFYTGGGSDFVDQNDALTGVQIGLSGTITGGGGGNILTPEVTLESESLTSATFNFSFTYDKDPALGEQTGTAGGTLVFDKVADTYTITLTDPLEGFSFDILHTSQLLSKEPTSNTGHPQIVVEKLQADVVGTPEDEDFYVQFTGNAINRANPFSLTTDGEGSSADSIFTVGGHEMVSNNNETWVSATQSTNGVAGDTIQKGELLTLRLFNSNVGIVTEATDPTATAGTMAIEFDGIGTSEDLMLILDLVDNGVDNVFGTGDDISITRAVYVENADIFKTGQVPSPYSSEFTLDNNDGLVIIEQNDYNAFGEEYLLQGVQIMQSGNGITGDAINLIGATGAGGGSNATGSLVNFDAADNDVLKIVDIAFSTTVTESPDADLDFFFQVADADGDPTDVQHILVDIA